MPGDGSANSLFPYPTFDPWSFMAVSSASFQAANQSDGNQTPTSNCGQPTTTAPPSFFGSFLSLPNSPTLPSFPMGSPNLPGFGANGLACARGQQQQAGTIMDSASFFGGAVKTSVQSTVGTSTNGTPPVYGSSNPMHFAYPSMTSFQLPPIAQQHNGGHIMSFRHGGQRIEAHDEDAFETKLAWNLKSGKVCDLQPFCLPSILYNWDTGSKLAHICIFDSALHGSLFFPIFA